MANEVLGGKSNKASFHVMCTFLLMWKLVPTFGSFSELKKKIFKPLYAIPEVLEHQNTDTYDCTIYLWKMIEFR